MGLPQIYTREQKKQSSFYDEKRKNSDETLDEGTPANTYSDDTLWLEINTEPLFEQLYNFWLGKKKVNGIWVDDDYSDPIMSKKLADKLLNILRLKVNPQTLISGYTKEQINEISWETCRVINADLMFETEEYGISISDFKLLMTNQIGHFILQTLNMGKDYMNTKLRFGSRSVNVIKREEEGIGGMI